MHRTRSGNCKRSMIWFILIFFMMTSITACKSKDPQSLFTPTPTVEIKLKEEPIVISIPTREADISQPLETESKNGLIVFSMANGEFHHLFAYNPTTFPITQLTSDPWDDDAPAISPNGDKIAFTSNRTGVWDIFLLDLVTKELTQITRTNDFEGSISWAPDSQWITYDVYQGDHYEIMIQSISDLSTAPIQLTEGIANNIEPAWSPEGREIAFVTDRSGRNEIWLARLDITENRFSKWIGSSDTDYDHPSWSPDGLTVTWERIQNESEIQLWNPQTPDLAPITIGVGSDPVWTPAGNGIIATLRQPNQNYFVAYEVQKKKLLLPPIPLPGMVSSYDWKSAQLSSNLSSFLSSTDLQETLFSNPENPPSSSLNRHTLVSLENVIAPQAYLSDTTIDEFDRVRELVRKKIGWDLLGTLENASLAVTTAPSPGINQNWLFTGRSIALNLAPFEAGLMILSREDFYDQTFWRLWVKCKAQDGSCGSPIREPVWDFSSRYSGDMNAYEEGGKISPHPAGYWIDFTELGARNGWERLPSQSNWRAYFPGILFNTFIYRQGLSWQEAMLELYPLEVINLLSEQ